MILVTAIDDVSPEFPGWFARTWVRTQRAEVHEAREGDDPSVHGIDDVAAIELGEPASAAQPARERMKNSPKDHRLTNCSGRTWNWRQSWARRRTRTTDIQWPRKQHIRDAREFAVIDV